MKELYDELKNRNLKTDGDVIDLRKSSDDTNLPILAKKLLSKMIKGHVGVWLGLSGLLQRKECIDPYASKFPSDPEAREMFCSMTFCLLKLRSQ